MAVPTEREYQCRCNITNEDQLAPLHPNQEIGRYNREYVLITDIEFEEGSHRPQCNAENAIHRFMLHCNKVDRHTGQAVGGVMQGSTSTTTVLIIISVIFAGIAFCLFIKLNQANKKLRANTAGSTS